MLSSFIEILNREPADPVIARNMPMAASAIPVTLLLLGYLLFVLKLGKMFMAHRQPYNLKNIILVYNFFQMIYNGVLCGFGTYYILFKPMYDRTCIVNFPMDHPRKDTERVLACLYYANKMIDLMDTVFFILRKSYKQITFLHVYHHVMMVYTTYWVLRLYGGPGQYHVMGLLNCFVHTVMYFYYLISARSPGLKGSLWWKKYITKIQIAQFIILLIQATAVLVFNPTCTFPRFMQYTQLFQASVMLILFGRFYINTYVKPRAKKHK